MCFEISFINKTENSVSKGYAGKNEFNITRLDKIGSDLTKLIRTVDTKIR